MFSPQHPSAAAKAILNGIRLLEVGEIQIGRDSGNPFFSIIVKQGPFGRAIPRYIWGRFQEDGSITWERISPEDAKHLVGLDLTGHVEVVAVDIEPEEFVNEKTGEVYTALSRSVVRFMDETLEQAVRRYGSTLRGSTQEEASPEQAAAAPATSVTLPHMPVGTQAAPGRVSVAPAGSAPRSEYHAPSLNGQMVNS